MKLKYSKLPEGRRASCWDRAPPRARRVGGHGDFGPGTRIIHQMMQKSRPIFSKDLCLSLRRRQENAREQQKRPGMNGWPSSIIDGKPVTIVTFFRFSYCCQIVQSYSQTSENGPIPNEMNNAKISSKHTLSYSICTFDIFSLSQS